MNRGVRIAVLRKQEKGKLALVLSEHSAYVTRVQVHLMIGVYVALGPSHSEYCNLIGQS